MSETPAQIRTALRASTMRMADECSVNMELWQEHSSLCLAACLALEAAALLDTDKQMATPSPCNESLEQWIDRNFAYKSIAHRREEEEPWPGEPFISLETAMDLTRQAVRDFTADPLHTDNEEWVRAIEAATRAVAAYVPFPNQEGSVFRGMYEKVAKPELLSAIRSLSTAPASKGPMEAGHYRFKSDGVNDD